MAAKKRKDKSTIRGFSIIFIIVVAVMCTLIYTKGFDMVKNGKTEESLKYIVGRINGSGDLIDYDNKIGVKSIDDVKYYRKENYVKIQFGNILLDWDEEGFKSEETWWYLNQMGIFYEENKKTGEWDIYYKGELLEPLAW